MPPTQMSDHAVADMAGRIRVGIFVVIGLLGSVTVHAEEPNRDRARVGSDLVVLYDFQSDSGDWVRDRSGAGRPIDLKIDNSQAVHRSVGKLLVRGNVLIRSADPPKRLTSAIRRSRELTLEAWIQPVNVEQFGPARILTLSRNGSNRNFTLGQDGDKFDVRLRTTATSANGIPSIGTDAGSVEPRLTHVVYTRNRRGEAVIFLDGALAVREKLSGTMENWNPGYWLALANEQEKSRPWRGTYHLIAIYKRALTLREVTQNFEAGAQATSTQALAALSVASSIDTRAVHFENRIAPLLAKHCLECHDAAGKQGGLDLSRREAAFAGGDSGASLVAGKSLESLIWTAVESDEMPAERPSLTKQEKEHLKAWIDDGAIWSLPQIDPAVYVHGQQQRQNWLRRLTIPEYIETVRSAVGVEIEKEANELLPADLRADGFSNTAYNLNVDLKHIEAYAQLAEIIVSRMDISRFADRFIKQRRFTDKTMGELISKMGKWILRGPVSESEVIDYRGISTTVASTGGNYDQAVSLILEAMLQSPRFLYRVENQRGDGTAGPIDEYELASRISYIVWGGPPDHELMRAADDGDLFELSAVEAQVERMLRDTRARQHSARFITEWLDLNRLVNLRPNADKYPHWSAELADDMRRETLAYFDEVVWEQQRPLSNLLNAQVTFVTSRLANHYHLKTEGVPVEGRDLKRHDLVSEPARGGILTQGSVLTVGGDEASMVSRGLLVMHELLRGVVNDPPPCVDTTPVTTKSGLTQRSIAMERIANASCGGCHAKFEPLAFGLEKYDGLGSFHEKDEHGNALREDGLILIPGAERAVPYQNAKEMMDLLAGSERVKESMTWKLTQFALGRPLVAYDAAEVQRIHQRSQQASGTYAALLKAIVLSDLVQLMHTESDEIK